MQLAAVARDASGHDVAGRPVSWNTSDPAVAAIGTSGLVQGVAQGTATISATVDGVKDTVRLSVTPVPVASVDLAFDTMSVAELESKLVSAVARDSSGNVLTGRQLLWSSSDTTVLRVSQNGELRGIAPGAVALRVAAEGKADSSRVTVVAVQADSVAIEPNSPVPLLSGKTVQLRAHAYFKGALLQHREFVWSSADTLHVTVDQTGLVTARQAVSGPTCPCQANVTADLHGTVARAQIVVLAPPVALVLSPYAVALQAGGPSRKVTGYLVMPDFGFPSAYLDVQWRTTNASVATVAAAERISSFPQALITGNSPGTALIIGSSGELADTIQVSVYGAATHVGGILSSSTTWTRAQSPYVMDSAVTIPPGLTLSIDPGVVVIGGGNYLRLRGALVASGAVSDTITLDSVVVAPLSADTPVSAPPAVLTLDYVRFQQGSIGDNTPARVLVTLRHSRVSFRDAVSHGPLTWATGSVIEFNTFARTGQLEPGSMVPVRNNLFLDRWFITGGTVKNNSFLNYGPWGYGVRQVADATLNYWGTTDPAYIDQRIWDFKDDPNPNWIVIPYEPVLAAPDPATPGW